MKVPLGALRFLYRVVLGRPQVVDGLPAPRSPAALLEDGTDVVFIQALLGHRPLATTLRTLRVRTDHLTRLRSPLTSLFANPPSR